MKSPLLRKLGLLPRQLPRTKRRLTARADAYERTPPVFVNSFPKSGTHLLLQILGALPETEHYGSFIATTPTLTFRERSQGAHRRLVERIAPGEILPGHLYYRPEHHALLVEKRCVHYFIYRDPRDVVVSEAYYLTYMNRWHRLHRYFKNLPGDRERITFSILGSAYLKVPYDYPDIAARFRRYGGWLEQTDVCKLTFEDLVPDRRRETTRRLIRFYLDRVGSGVAVNGLVDRALAAVDSTASKTFRKGKVGGWVDEFTPEHRDQMRSVAGRLLVELGYESSLDW
jgi:hypothetical protein